MTTLVGYSATTMVDSEEISVSETLALAPAVRLTDAQFAALCRQNPLYDFELSADGALILNPPMGGTGSHREFVLLGQLFSWAATRTDGLGFSSQALFSLPNGAKRSPDFAWVQRSDWEQLSQAERDGYPPVVPFFVVELRSPSDELEPLQRKMEEYRDCGVSVGWLIDPQRRLTELYGADGSSMVTEDATLTSSLLPELVLDVSALWQ